MVLAEKLVKNNLPNQSGNPESLKSYRNTPKALQLIYTLLRNLLPCTYTFYFFTSSCIFDCTLNDFYFDNLVYFVNAT